MSKVTIERARLIKTVKDMNDVLGLKPTIKTKDRSEDDIIADITREAKGYDADSKKFVAENAVTRADELQADTFKVLEEIGVLAAPKAKKEDKAEKSVKKTLGKGEPKMKSASTRGGGIRTKDFKTLKTALLSGSATSVASQLDAMMLEPHTVEELQNAMDKVGKINVTGHIKYRYEVNGFDYKDKRKNSRDTENTVQLVGITDGVSAAKKREFPLEEGHAEKPAKVEKKAKKEDKAEKADKPAKKDKEPKKAEKTEKKAKKSKE